MLVDRKASKKKKIEDMLVFLCRAFVATSLDGSHVDIIALIDVVAYTRRGVSGL